MKKTILVFALAAIVMYLSGCKAHERCPAYGSIKNPTSSSQTGTRI